MKKLEVLMFFLQTLHFNPTSLALLNILEGATRVSLDNDNVKIKMRMRMMMMEGLGGVVIHIN